jgi:hypothetical protein
MRLLLVHSGLGGVHKSASRIGPLFDLKCGVFDPEPAFEFVRRIFQERIVWIATRHH